MNPLNYLKETRTELRHVSWPTRRQAIQFTALVIAISLLFAAMLGFFDFIYDFIIERLILNIDISPEQAPLEGSAVSDEITPEEPAAEDIGGEFVIPSAETEE